jgi:hypothetical protein
MVVVLFAVALTILASPPTAPVVLVIQDPSGRQAVGTSVTAEPIAVATGATAVSATVRAGRDVAMDLRPGLWRIAAAADDRWAWPIDVEVTDGPSTRQQVVSITVWPLGKVAGTVTVPPSAQIPDEVKLLVHRTVRPDSFSKPRTDQPVTAVCPVRDGRWICPAAAGLPLDIELLAQGFGPRYLWDVQVPLGQTQRVGNVPLFRGSSVSGWVLGPGGHRLKESPTVELKSQDKAAIDLPKSTEFQFKAASNGRGFFQIAPIPPGRYHVNASSGDYVSDHAVAQVSPGQEERLRAPLVLSPPATLHVSVSPPLTPSRRPWSVRLVSQNGLRRAHTFALDERASTDGHWSMARLPRGEFTLMLLSDRQNVWYQEKITVDGSDEYVQVDVPMIHVAGSVLMGGQPFAAVVQLGDRSTGHRMSFATGDAGTFEGAFPARSASAVQWSAWVHGRSPAFTRTLAKPVPQIVNEALATFDLRLSDGRIDGSVVDERGAPVPAAYVTVRREDDTIYDQDDPSQLVAGTAVADTDGKFRVSALEPGRYRIVARSGDDALGVRRTSGTQTARVEGNEDPPTVRLVLAAAHVVEGRITTPEGSPVVGASVLVSSRERPEIPVRPQFSDANGVFRATVPYDTKTVTFTVSQIGVVRQIFARPIARTPVSVVMSGSAGRLVLNLGDAKQGAASFLVSRDGGWENLAALLEWGLQNGEDVNSGAISVPLMSPGRYSICRISSFVAEYGAFLAGGLPKGRCESGTLEPGGQLSLDLRPNAVSAKGASN